MFKKKQPKIVQISMAASGDFIFTFGLGRDGKVYSWNATTVEWVLHEIKAPVEAEHAEA